MDILPINQPRIASSCDSSHGFCHSIHVPFHFQLPYVSDQLSQLSPVYLPCMHADERAYSSDAYLASAASALAINTVVRSAFGAGFPLFASQMFKKLGVPGASSLLGGLALLFLPVPFVLYKYGRKIRSLSKNAMVLDE
jgi:hypothetical protein